MPYLQIMSKVIAKIVICFILPHCKYKRKYNIFFEYATYLPLSAKVIFYLIFATHRKYIAKIVVKFAQHFLRAVNMVKSIFSCSVNCIKNSTVGHQSTIVGRIYYFYRIFGTLKSDRWIKVNWSLIGDITGL